MESTCPYCQKSLTTPPKRKTKCQFCSNDIYVRSTQKLFPSILLTAEDARATDWVKKLEIFGIVDNEFHAEKGRLNKKFGTQPKSTDVIWGLFNGLLTKVKDYQSLSLIYYQMGWFVYEEDKNPFKMLQLAAKMKLFSLKQMDCQKVRIDATVEASCKPCQKLDNQVFTLKEALEKMPIPHQKCIKKFKNKKESFCMCCYEPEVEINKK